MDFRKITISDPARVVLTLETVSVSDEIINETINNKSKKIIELVQLNPKITTAELMEKLGCSRATVARLMKELKEKGYLARVGSNKKGTWKILK